MPQALRSSKEQNMNNQNGNHKAGAPTDLQALRQTVARLEHGRVSPHDLLHTGLDGLDDMLPRGGLARGRVHEIIGRDRNLEGAAYGFTAALASCLAGEAGDVLWVRQHSEGGSRARDAHVSGRGAHWLGLDPDRLIQVAARDAAEVLWVAEEALRCAGLAAVVAEVRGMDLTAGRRLQLAAETSGVTGLVLATGQGSRQTSAPKSISGTKHHAPETSRGSAAETRWRIGPALSADPFRTPVWDVSLERCRGGLANTAKLAWSITEQRFVDPMTRQAAEPSAKKPMHPDLFEQELHERELAA